MGGAIEAPPRCAQLGNKKMRLQGCHHLVRLMTWRRQALIACLTCSTVPCSQLVLLQPIPSAFTPAIRSHHPFLQHLQYLLSIHRNVQVRYRASHPSPPFQLHLPKQPKQPSAFNPFLRLCEALREPTAQNALLFPLGSGCTAFISKVLVLPLPPTLDAKGRVS